MMVKALSNRHEPAAMFAALRPLGHPFLLDDAGGLETEAHCILGIDPIGSYTWHRGKGRLSINGVTNDAHDLNRSLRCLQKCLPPPHDSECGFTELPFCGGLLGYLGYDAGRAYEPSVDNNPADSTLPDLWFGAYDIFMIRRAESWTLYGCGAETPANRARFEAVWAKAETAVALETLGLDASSSPKIAVPSVSPEGHRSLVDRVRELIKQGDVYQINLTQRWLVAGDWDAAQLFAKLQREHPAPNAALFELAGSAIVSLSPESFLKLEDDRVESRPIKGTSPRFADAVRDLESAERLLVSEKDRAELAMIVDLIRNDLSRVCRPGTVLVHDHAHLESAPTVHHLVTSVTGQLRPGRDVYDLLAASFPGGSITGAPKIRAMERIDQLETLRRGIYTGSIGMISRTRRAEFSIAIRTVVLEGGYARIYGGGGVTIDSDPQSEYDESVAKVIGILRILGAEILHEGLPT